MKTRSKVLLLIVSALALVIATIFGTLAYLTDEDVVTNTFTVGNIEIVLDELDVDENGVAIPNANPARVDKNEYHLIPNHTYIKDPTVTVKAGSEESYVRMLVTINYSKELDGIFAYHFGHKEFYNTDHTPDAFDISKIFKYNAENWVCVGNTENETANTRTYEFYYIGDQKGTSKYTVKNTGESDVPLAALFTEFTVPSFFTKEDLAKLVTKDTDGKFINQFKIDVVAHAIQADGFKPTEDNPSEERIKEAVDAAWAAFDGQCPADTTAAG